MCYIFDSFVYNKVYDEGKGFLFSREEAIFLSGGSNFSLGRKQFFSQEEIVFLRDVFGMRSGWGLTGRGAKRTRFAFQKGSFYLAKGLVLDCKRTRFEGQKESFSDCWMLNAEC